MPTSDLIIHTVRFLRSFLYFPFPCLSGYIQYNSSRFMIFCLSVCNQLFTRSSVLAWRIPGTVEPDGLPSMGSHRVGHDWSDLAAAADAWVSHGRTGHDIVLEENFDLIPATLNHTKYKCFPLTNKQLQNRGLTQHFSDWFSGWSLNIFDHEPHCCCC